jgi:RHH-type proline utilization regulon transcriptional repressor/proline dehydrogenase/delta 1-pyrroline-5-carboxylate dehydrogenase
VSLDPEKAAIAVDWLAKLAARAGEPVVRHRAAPGNEAHGRAVRHGPHDRRRARAQPRAANARYLHSYDMLGEAAFTARDAERYFAAYEKRDRRDRRVAPSCAADPVFARPGISIKLSALHPRYESRSARACSRSSRRASRRSPRARAQGDIGVTLDAEEADRLGCRSRSSSACSLRRALRLGRLRARGAGVPEARALRDRLARRARAPRRRRIMARLVKGAYWDTEVKRAQMQGFRLSGLHAQVQHRRLLPRVRGAHARGPEAFYGSSRRTTRTRRDGPRARAAGQPFEFQRLHGMGEDLYERGRRRWATRAAYTRRSGSHEDLLPYLVPAPPRERREHLLREPHRRSGDPDRDVDRRSRSRVAGQQRAAIRRSRCRGLYPDRENSGGFVFADEPVSGPFLPSSSRSRASDHVPRPLVDGARARERARVRDPVERPAIGDVDEATTDAVEAALAAAARARVPERRARQRSSSGRPTASRRAASSSWRSSRAKAARRSRRAGRGARGRGLLPLLRAPRARAFREPEALRARRRVEPSCGSPGAAMFAGYHPWNFTARDLRGQAVAAFAAGQSR